MNRNLPDSTMKARLERPLLIAILTMTFIVFAGVIGHGFVHFDDNINIYQNPHLKGLDGESLRWMATDATYARRYMPLGWLSYAVDRQVFGLNPRSYHAGNLLLHLINTALVFCLLKRLLILGRAGGASRDDAFPAWAAAAGALVWAINPLRVEVVAWASSRIYCAALFLVLIWLLAWLKSQDITLARSRRRWLYALSVAAYAASLLTYPLALFAPVLLFALEVFPLRRAGVKTSDWFGPGKSGLWNDKLPFLLVALAGLALTLWARNAGGIYNKPITLDQLGLLPRAAQAVYVWTYYVWKPWAPFDLAPVYPTLLNLKAGSWPFVAGFLFIGGTTLGLCRLRQRWPAPWAFWICHLLILVPFLGLSEYNHSAADRYSYLHGLLWAGVVAFGLLWASQHVYQPRLAGVAVVAALMMFGLLAWQQTFAWQNTIVLHRHLIAALGEHPRRARFDEVLAMHYLQAGLTNEAISSYGNAIHYEQARTDRHIVEEGVLARAHTALGDILSDQAKTDDAIGHYQAATGADPRYAPAHVNLGILFAKLGRFQEARSCFERNLTLDPRNPASYHNLALTLKSLGQTEQAEEHLNQAKRLAASP